MATETYLYANVPLSRDDIVHDRVVAGGLEGAADIWGDIVATYGWTLAVIACIEDDVECGGCRYKEEDKSGKKLHS